MDRNDPLRSYRTEFLIPSFKSKRVIYFTGNSLGLQPRTLKRYLSEELNDWSRQGVEGHFHARRPWLYYHKFTKKALSKLVGAKANEVIAMNQLTINLHLMMATFYRPSSIRFKIMIEAGAFPSDQYAIESQLKWHGLNPQDALIEIQPREEEFTLRTDDIVKLINANKDSLSLVLIGGLQYYTGQLFNIERITAAAHAIGAIAGFDLAHAIGNVPLKLHKYEVDFAVWCSYKYLNSGPGAIAGAFIHEKHGNNTKLIRLAGWWGHDEKARFEMRKGFVPMLGADGWQVSNVPIFQASAHLASLKIFQRAGIGALRKKSIILTSFLEFLLDQFDPLQHFFRIITPKNKSERGSQLSIFIFAHGKRIANALFSAGVSVDWREPNVIRVAPVPLYNTFEEVFRFASIFTKAITKASKLSSGTS